eukprot:snap_masked-scaffold_33-processed-gene-3.28-mRNA-1 protein AED:1.00 eAED:1.00 QI:0/0/0/0/1/1/3/0/86
MKGNNTTETFKKAEKSVLEHFKPRFIYFTSLLRSTGLSMRVNATIPSDNERNKLKALFPLKILLTDLFNNLFENILALYSLRIRID